MSPASRVGIVCQPGLEDVVLAGSGHLGWVEIEPQISWYPGRGADSVLASGPVGTAQQAGLPVLLHSIGAPVGGTVPPRADQLDLLARLVAELECPWISEHLSILRVPGEAGPAFTGVLLAPPQTESAVHTAAANVERLRRAVGVPVAVETGVNYLKPRAGEMSDGTFFAAVAETGDCGLLLDLHNLWCNEQNGRQPALEVVGELPLDRVWEIHVAAGYWRDGYYLDAHCGPAAPRVLELLATVAPLLPNLRAVVLEVSPDRLGTDGLSVDVLATHLGELAAIVGPSDPAAGSPVITTGPPVDERGGRAGRADLLHWERTLGALVRGDRVGGELAAAIASDPGHRVWRDIAASSRRGQLAGTLPVTTGLLLRSLGETAALDALGEMWARLPPAETSAAEIQQVAPYLHARWGSSVPELAEVLDAELAMRGLAPPQPTGICAKS